MEKYRVLIVEDEKDTQFILDKLLVKNGYETKTTSNGVEALNVLKEFDPVVILADWTMPVMDGLELCNSIKKDESFKLIYFIILTARASLKDRVTGLDIGADDFLVKPVENQELLARIRTGIRINVLQNELKKFEHNKAIVEMACTIGHKINNPLSSLIMAVKNLKEDIISSEKYTDNEDVQIIEESVERIKKLAEDLVHIENPTIINYTSENKMIKLD
jgi:sigma-B regulation protein RsbU (phosphoserine phosphatase)